MLLVACGGGNDDDPSPSNEPGVLTVSNATVDGLNGVYGNGALNLTDVDKKNPIGSVPELCTFRFDGANKVGSVRHRVRRHPLPPGCHQPAPGVPDLDGKEYGSGEPADTAVVRASDQVRFTGKTLTASDGFGRHAARQRHRADAPQPPVGLLSPRAPRVSPISFDLIACLLPGPSVEFSPCCLAAGPFFGAWVRASRAGRRHRGAGTLNEAGGTMGQSVRCCRCACAIRNPCPHNWPAHRGVAAPEAPPA